MKERREGVGAEERGAAVRRGTYKEEGRFTKTSNFLECIGGNLVSPGGFLIFLYTSLPTRARASALGALEEGEEKKWYTYAEVLERDFIILCIRTKKRCYIVCWSNKEGENKNVQE